MRFASLTVVLAFILPFTSASPQNQGMIARNVREARDPVAGVEARDAVWKREAEAGPPAPGWKRDAEAGPPAPGWKRDAEAGPPAPGWKRDAEAGPPAPGWKRDAEAGSPSPVWKRDADAAPLPPTWKRHLEPTPPSWISKKKRLAAQW